MSSNTNPMKRIVHIEDLSDAVLRCHAFGHNWDTVILPDRQFKDGTVSGQIESRCDCGTTRPEHVNMMGDSWGRQYSYRDDYPFSATKGEFRAEWLRRQQVKRQKSRGKAT